LPLTFPGSEVLNRLSGLHERIAKNTQLIQNANAHKSGMGPQWAATKAWWDDPTPDMKPGQQRTWL
jgi:hypothetical protein